MFEITQIGFSDGVKDPESVSHEADPGPSFYDARPDARELGLPPERDVRHSGHGDTILKANIHFRFESDSLFNELRILTWHSGDIEVHAGLEDFTVTERGTVHPKAAGHLVPGALEEWIWNVVDIGLRRANEPAPPSYDGFRYASSIYRLEPSALPDPPVTAIEEFLDDLEALTAYNKHTTRGLWRDLSTMTGGSTVRPDSNGDPTPEHRRYADYALERDDSPDSPEDIPDRFRDQLARRIGEAFQSYTDCERDFLDQYCTEDEDGHPRIKPEYQEHFGGAKLSVTLGMHPWPTDFDIANGMLWKDKVGIDWLAEQTDGDGLAGTLDDAYNQARERWQQHHDSRELFGFWFDLDARIPMYVQPFATVSRWLWLNEVKPEIARRQNKQRATLQGVQYGNDTFAKIDKTMGAVSTKGKLSHQRDGDTQPVDVEDASDLEIDDERFTNAPGVLRMIPQQWGIAHDELPEPSALQLPLMVDPEDGASVAFRMFADSQVQLTAKAAKIAVGLHLLSPQSGGLGSVELGELTKWIHQGLSKPGRKRNRRAVRDNLIGVRSLGVPSNLDGTGRNIQIFEIHPLDSLEPDAEVVFGHTRGFEQFLHEIQTTDGPLRSLNGWFLLNADGFMRISGNDSDAARMYLTLCALWNDHNWDPDRIPFRSIDELARRANQLSEQARLALSGEGTNRDQLRQGRHQTRKVLEKLIDEHGLVATLDEKGQRKVKILPNERHREAWAHLRSNRDQKIGLDDS